MAGRVGPPGPEWEWLCLRGLTGRGAREAEANAEDGSKRSAACNKSDAGYDHHVVQINNQSVTLWMNEVWIELFRAVIQRDRRASDVSFRALSMSQYLL